MPARQKPLIGILMFAGVFLYLGWEVVRQETDALRGGSASRTWPTVEGRVVSSTVQAKHGTGGDLTRYYPVVEYEYSVKGKLLRGNRIAFDTQPMDHTSAASIVKRYSAGRSVPVFYDPENTANSVLEPGTSRGSWLGIGVGIVFALVAGAMLVTRLVNRSSS